MNRILCCLFCLLPAAGLAAAESDYDQRPEGKAFIQRMADKHDFEVQRVRALLAEAEHRPEIIEAISRPAEKRLAWHEYRDIFLQPARIAGGADFIREHATLFRRAETEYGVPAPIIAAIIGVETRYGEFVGRDRVLDALATLGFDYPRRADFFLGELEQFLILAEEENLAADTVVGSYAGAMGMPQFIPSSYRHYAVDFNDNGQRNLWDDPADVIGSVANYLAEHGWQANAAVALPAQASARERTGLERNQLRTHYRYRELAAAGIEAEQPVSGDTEVGLLELEGDSGSEFWIGLSNFFVITRYNHSHLYAMAVFQLSEAIANQLQNGASSSR